jgi:hypothetical protein
MNRRSGSSSITRRSPVTGIPQRGYASTLRFHRRRQIPKKHLNPIGLTLSCAEYGTAVPLALAQAAARNVYDVGPSCETAWGDKILSAINLYIAWCCRKAGHALSLRSGRQHARLLQVPDGRPSTAACPWRVIDTLATNCPRCRDLQHRPIRL